MDSAGGLQPERRPPQAVAIFCGVQILFGLAMLPLSDDRLHALHLVAKMPRAGLTRRHLSPTEVGVPVLSHSQWAKRPAPIAELIAQWVRPEALNGARG